MSALCWVRKLCPMNGLMKLNQLANIRYAYPRMEAVPDMVNTSRPNCLYLFLMGMISKRQDRIHTSHCRYKLHATLAVAYETPRLLAIIEMMPAIISYNIFIVYCYFYVVSNVRKSWVQWFYLLLNVLECLCTSIYTFSWLKVNISGAKVDKNEQIMLHPICWFDSIGDSVPL